MGGFPLARSLGCWGGVWEVGYWSWESGYTDHVGDIGSGDSCFRVPGKWDVVRMGCVCMWEYGLVGFWFGSRIVVGIGGDRWRRPEYRVQTRCPIVFHSFVNPCGWMGKPYSAPDWISSLCETVRVFPISNQSYRREYHPKPRTSLSAAMRRAQPEHQWQRSDRSRRWSRLLHVLGNVSLE